MMKDILSITGQPGLFRIVSRNSKNLIVESLINGKRFPAFSTNKILSLEDIAIFTDTTEVPLKEVFKKIAEKEDSKPSIDPKSSSDVLKGYFAQVLPEYDKDRVYVSDIKKVIQWYNLLQEKDMLNFEEDETNSEENQEEKSEE